MTDIVAAGLDTHTVFVSHLSDEELAAIGQQYPEFRLAAPGRHRRSGWATAVLWR